MLHFSDAIRLNLAVHKPKVSPVKITPQTALFVSSDMKPTAQARKIRLPEGSVFCTLSGIV